MMEVDAITRNTVEYIERLLRLLQSGDVRVTEWRRQYQREEVLRGDNVFTFQCSWMATTGDTDPNPAKYIQNAD